MQNAKKEVNWNDYIKTYVEFINTHDIKYFFELDIDNVVGYKEVLRLRNKLEKETNKKCIPVWHKSRGLEEYIKSCKEYDYIAIGGIASKEIQNKEYYIFNELIKIAHKNKCRVHGLGFTSMEGLKKYRFDSVDSTSWKSGDRFGQIHIFNQNTKKIEIHKVKNARLINQKEADQHNFDEWCKFQRYAERKL